MVGSGPAAAAVVHAFVVVGVKGCSKDLVDDGMRLSVVGYLHVEVVSWQPIKNCAVVVMNSVAVAAVVSAS